MYLLPDQRTATSLVGHILSCMLRTTPPRPVDVTVHFPELAPMARTVVRLHPRAGDPVTTDSSIGGPMLWPAGEPWPTCPEHGAPESPKLPQAAWINKPDQPRPDEQTLPAQG